MSTFWSQCLEQLRGEVPAPMFNTWLVDLKEKDFNPETKTLTLLTMESKVPTIRKTFLQTITNAASSIHGEPVVVLVEAATIDTPQPTSTPNVFDGNSESTLSDEKLRLEAGLLPNLTFKNYVNGTANQLAVAAAEYVAQTIGPQYNPLYIYGGVGLGKTHLMQAIGHRYLDLHPRAKVRCISAQDFIIEYTAATRDPDKTRKALEQFDNRYKSLDLLLIDDVQSFSGAKGSQAQFFRAFEALVPKNKQVVLTSDTYTRNLKDMEPRLVTRLSQGLSVAIEPPELEMRVAILQNKASMVNFDLPEEVAMFIAKRLKSNVRELEGALQQIIAYQQFQPAEAREITIDIVKHVLRDVIGNANPTITIENIQKTVADYYNIKVAEMHSKRKLAKIALPRQIAMYLARELTQQSLPEIGESFGGRDHATVIHAVKKITNSRKSNSELNHEIHVLEQMIKG